MAVTHYTLTANFTDLLGDAYSATSAKVVVWIETNVGSGEGIVDSDSDLIALGPKRATADSNGLVTFANLIGSDSDSEDIGLAEGTLQYRVTAEYVNALTRKRGERWSSGWFSLTANVNLADVVAEQYISATYLSQATAILDAKVDEAEAERLGAEAARDLAEQYRDEAHDISGISTSDGVVEALIQDTGSDTSAALTASIDAKVGVPPINAKAPQWGIAADGVTDDTAAIQALLDYAVDNGRNVYLPRGDYLVSTLVLPMHIEVIGAGLGGYAATGSQAATVLRQRAKVGAEVMGPLLQIVSDDTSGAYNFGPSRLAHLVLRGSASNPTSRAIEFVAADGTKAPIQDTVHYHDILVRGFRGGGFYIPKGARPLVFDTINFLFNGGYGIEMWGKDSSDGSGTPAYLTQAVHFSNISGDANINGLIYLRKFDSGGAVTFTNIKSEKRINPPEGNVAGQADCLIFEDCDNTPIRLNGVSHVSSVVSGATYEPPGAAVVVKGTGKPWISGLTTVAVRVRSTDVAGSPAVLRDDALGYSIAVTATGSDLREDFYGGSGNYKRSGRDLDEALTSGESTLPRDRVFSSTALSTGVLRLSYIRAKKTESIGSIIVPGAGTAAGATPTKIRVGVFEEDETTGDLTLVASSANDTTKFSSATDGVENTFTLSAAFTKIRGKRYAIGALVVTAAAAPTIKTVSGLSAAALAKAPRLSASVTGQTDMPSSVAVGSLSSTSVRVYAELVPA